jgi:hypothetical protein
MRCQAQIFSANHERKSLLGILGLASQALMHVILAVSWLRLVRIPSDGSRGWKFLFNWYNLFGWAPVDNVVFAIVQGRLFWSALQERKKLAVEEGR